jgi:hypothetical protein
MASELKPKDETQVLDLGLPATGDGLPSHQSPQHDSKIAVDLSDAANSGVAWQLAKGGAKVLLEDIPRAPVIEDASGPAQPGALGQSFGDTGQNNPTLAFHNVLVQDGQLNGRRPFSIWLKIVGGIAAATFVIVGLTLYMTGDLASMYALLGIPERVVATLPPPQNVVEKKPEVSPNPIEDTQQKTAPISSASERDIWSVVTNKMGGQALPRGTTLTSDQEASFRAGLSHEFHYQRYKTVMDLAALHAPGSQELLREALASKKFWLRMRALIALADMGDDITDDDVKQALGNTHSELRSRFFKRFEKSPCSVGCYFVARASMKHLDAPGRTQLVKVVARERSDAAEAFMVAATFDGDQMVRATANELITGLDIDQSVWQDVKNKYGLAH